MEPRILPNSKGSYSKKLAKQRAHELFTREAKTLQRSLSVYPETDFRLKKLYLCKVIRVFHFANGVEINTTV